MQSCHKLLARIDTTLVFKCKPFVLRQSTAIFTKDTLLFNVVSFNQFRYLIAILVLTDSCSIKLHKLIIPSVTAVGSPEPRLFVPTWIMIYFIRLFA
jgi:hypothetical protein